MTAVELEVPFQYFHDTLKYPKINFLKYYIQCSCVLCFRHLSESRILLDALHIRSKFANFCHDLMQNHLS